MNFKFNLKNKEFSFNADVENIISKELEYRDKQPNRKTRYQIKQEEKRKNEELKQKEQLRYFIMLFVLIVFILLVALFCNLLGV